MIRHSRLLVASCACALALFLSYAPVVGQTTLIATGAMQVADGYTAINVDAFGAWTDTTFGGQGDRFNPAGGPPLSAQPVAFSSGFFLFSGGTHRELLSVAANWQAVSSTNPATPAFNTDTSLDRNVTSPNVASDSNGDGVNDTVTSAFTVFGGHVDLSVALTQQLSVVTPGVSSALRQDYVFTNNSTSPLSFNLVRSFDADLVWTPGGFENDNVGTTANGTGQVFVYQSEVAHGAASAVTLSSPQATSYYGGKNGVTTSGDPFGFGTDVHVWNAYGVPTGWDNNIAGVGVGINGDSGTTPPGSAAQADGFIGLGFDVQLGAGQSTTITVYHTYGQVVPVPEPGTLMLIGSLLAGLSMFRRR